MTAAILDAIHHPDELQETAEHGRRRVLARYTWKLLAEQLDSVWETVARRTYPRGGINPCWNEALRST